MRFLTDKTKRSYKNGNVNSKPETYFASARRSDEYQLQHQIQLICTNPVTEGLLKTVGGLIAILNENRQILAVNQTVGQLIGMSDIEGLMGLRPGEALGCAYHNDMPGGCGTGRYCSTCGAAIAMVLCLQNDAAVEKTCAITIVKDQNKEDVFFKVNAAPIAIQNQKFILLFLQDITEQQEQAALEKTFFHDIGNIVNGLLGISNVFDSHEKLIDPELTRHLKVLSLRLAKEIEMQKAISRSAKGTYLPNLQEVTFEKILIEIKAIFFLHPAASGKTLSMPDPSPRQTIKVDLPLLLRVLTNMLTNAFEATPRGGEVKLWIEENAGGIVFCVWNKQAIPEDIKLRIFQRHFSTKEKSGRGFGTHSMKYFGEQFLKGKVDFDSSVSEGTVFRLTLPVSKVEKAADAEKITDSYIILLVEDDPFNRKLAKILFERLGHKVISAENGMEAIDILGRTDVDAILMDDQMPVMDGVTATRLIRGIEKGDIPQTHPDFDLLNKVSRKIKGYHVPIFAMTAHAMPGDQHRYLEAGMDTYFTKPFDPSEIMAELKRIIISDDKPSS